MIYSNDGNAAALYAHRVHFGAGCFSRSSVSAIVGTGLGGGIVQWGRVVEGTSGQAGELGHVSEKEHDASPRVGGRRAAPSQALSGLSQVSSRKRAKSESALTTARPCSRASAASAASLTRLPRRSRSDTSRPRMSRYP